MKMHTVCTIYVEKMLPHLTFDFVNTFALFSQTEYHIFKKKKRKTQTFYGYHRFCDSL